MNELNRIEPFKFWCQKVLPTVYDDSLSYYEVLNKVVSYLNDVITLTDKTADNFVELNEMFLTLKDFVDNYFNNLDVQNEINNKLDVMSIDGTLNNIINNEIFSDVRNAISTNANNILNLTDIAVKKTDTEYVSMAQLGNDVKQALTGGSTAVVGENSVGTNNIINSAVTTHKLQSRIKWNDVSFGVNNTLFIDTNAKTITFRSKASETSPFVIISNGYLKSIPATTLLYEDNTSYFVQYNSDTNTISIDTSMSNDNSYIGFIKILGEKIYHNFNTIPLVINGRLLNDVVVETDNIVDNSITTEKIANKAITSNKLIPNIKWLDNTNGINNSLWIDTTNKTLTFRSLASETGSFNIVINGVFKGVQPLAISYTDNTMYFIQYDETTAKFIAETMLNENYVYVGFIKIIDKGVWHNFNFPVYVNGNYTGLNYINTNVAVCNEPIEFNFVTGVVHFPQSFEFNCCNHIFRVTGQSDLTLDEKGYIVFNMAKAIFENVNKTTGDRISVVVGGYIKADNFAIVNGAKFSIISNPDNSYSTTPEIALFGDSVVAGTGCTIPFYELIYKKSGIKMLNYGVGASGYIQNASQDKKVRIGQGKCELGIVDYPPLNNTIPYRIQTIAVNLPQKYIAIKAGINDFGYGVSIENFKTAVKDCITMIYNADKTPIIITPQPILKKVSNYGIAMEEYITALSDVCKEENAIFIDDYHNNSINTQNSTCYARYLADSVHPNNNGHTVMACRILDGLKHSMIINDML